MPSKIYYFFCGRCGKDVASHEMYSDCPFCHSSHSKFKLLAQAEGPETEEIRLMIENVRAKWIAHERNNLNQLKKRQRKH